MLSDSLAISAARTCFVHIGTHKTGSTALQYFLHKNARKLAALGVYVPVSGRLSDSAGGAGHHCVAWDLLGSAPESPLTGTIENLVAEIGAQPLPLVCISSEEFEHLHLRPNHFQRLRAGLAGIGYRTVVVVYLRPQSDYLEALYAEVTRHAPVRDFWSCYREMLEHGALDLWPENKFCAMFDYERLIAPFASIVGAENIIVRAFRRDRKPHDLIDDFLKSVLHLQNCFGKHYFERSALVNRRLRFAEVVRGIQQNRVEVFQHASLVHNVALESCDGRFDPLRLHELLRILLRFGFSNLRLFLRYRVLVGCFSRTQLLRVLGSLVYKFDGKQRRYEILRRIFYKVRT